MANMTININMARKCQECGKGGATDSGICLGCANKALKGLPMKSQAGKMVQARFKKINKVPNDTLEGRAGTASPSRSGG